MQLQQSTWPEVEVYLERSRGILVPVGSTEQHGPMGVIGTDAICAEVVARGVGEAAGAVVAPTIHVGMSEHHMQFAGSMTLRPSTLIAVVRDYILSLAAHGFERFFFVNAHAGNIPSLKAAFYEAYGELRMTRGAEAPPVRCKIVNWSEPDAVKELRSELFGSADGSHASATEVALTQFADAANIKDAALDPPVAPGAPGRFYDSRDFRTRHADGRIASNPALATPEAGRRLFERAVDELARQYADFLAEA